MEGKFAVKRAMLPAFSPFLTMFSKGFSLVGFKGRHVK